MRRSFVLLVDDATGEQQNAVTDFVKGKCAYWHHFSDAWLLSVVNEEWTAKEIRDKLHEIVPGANVLVLPVEAKRQWAGRGPEKMFNWLKSTWTKTD